MGQNAFQAQWADAGAVTRSILVSYPITYIMCLIFDQYTWPLTLFMFTAQDVLKARVWTFYTSTFVQIPGSPFFDLISMVFIAMIILQMMPQREKVLGSTTALFWIANLGFWTRIVFLIIAYLGGLVLGLIYPQYRHYGETWFGPYESYPCVGLWPLYLVILSVRCYGDPTGLMSCYGLCQIPNKWYPLLIYAFFALLSQSFFRPDLAAGLIVGYLYGYRIVPFDAVLPPRSCIRRFEDMMWRCCCRCCTGRNAYCMAFGAKYVFIDETDQSGIQTLTSLEGGLMRNPAQSQQSVRTSAPSRPSFEAFSGSGNRLGGS